MSASRPEHARSGRSPGTGRAWPDDLAALEKDGVDIEALAYVLANTCRWGGRTRRFYSVAQHAVVASEAVEALDGLQSEAGRRLALRALIADARIAWLGDDEGRDTVSGRAAERMKRDGAEIDRAVRQAAGINGDLSVDDAELLRFVARMTDAAERRDLPDAVIAANAGAAFPPLKRRIRPVDPGRAAKLWLTRFRALASPPLADGHVASRTQSGETGNE